MAYIEWEDADGTHVLTPDYPAGPARRFQSWTPDVNPVGPARFGLGTGQRYQFQFRRDYLAEFSIPGLSPLQLAEFIAFKIFALSGCPFLVYCEDTDANVYTCRLAEGATPTLEFSDNKTLEYTLSLVARNEDAAPMLCNYRSA